MGLAAWRDCWTATKRLTHPMTCVTAAAGKEVAEASVCVGGESGIDSVCVDARQHDDNGGNGDGDWVRPVICREIASVTVTKGDDFETPYLPLQ